MGAADHKAFRSPVCTTYGVLSMARRVAPEITPFTVAPRPGEVRLANGLRVLADHGYADCRTDLDVFTSVRTCCDGTGKSWVGE